MLTQSRRGKACKLTKDSELIHEILSFVVISRLVKLVDREGELSPGDLLRSGGSVLFHNG